MPVRLMYNPMDISMDISRIPTPQMAAEAQRGNDSTENPYMPPSKKGPAMITLTMRRRNKASQVLSYNRDPRLAVAAAFIASSP